LRFFALLIEFGDELFEIEIDGIYIGSVKKGQEWKLEGV